MDRVRVRVKKKYRVRRIGLAIIAILLISVIIVGIIRLSGFTAEIAHDEMTVSEKYSAVIIRDEKVYTAASYTRADYLVPEGSLVEPGTPVMNVYKRGYSDGMGITLQQLSEEVYAAQLEQLGDVKDSTLSGYNEAVYAIEARIAEASLSGSEESIIALEQLLSEKMDERSEYLKSILQPTEKLKNLYDREEQAKANLNNWLEEVDTEDSGIISFYFDGYENALNKDKLSIISAPVVSGALKKKNAVSWTVESETLTYRLIDPNEWYCAFLTDSDDAFRLAEGVTYDISVSGYGEYSATALKCVISGNKVVNILRVNDELGELAYARNVSITVNAVLSGERVELDSVINDENGQFIDIMQDGVKKRIEIEVLAVDGDTAIIRSASDEYDLSSGVKYWVPKKRIFKSEKD